MYKVHREINLRVPHVHRNQPESASRTQRNQPESASRTQRNQPESVMINKTQVEAVSSFRTDESDMKSLWKISRHIRKEILAEH